MSPYRVIPTIRPETPGDHCAVSRVHRRAFGRAEEADLVDRLRQEASPTVSIIATDGVVENGTGPPLPIIGHIFFSPVTIEPETTEPEARPVVAMGLAPMAVVPERQREGVVVLGHPGYYPRFGFHPAETFGLQSEYDVPSEAFLAMELVVGALDAPAGQVRYQAAFGSVE